MTQKKKPHWNFHSVFSKKPWTSNMPRAALQKGYLGIEFHGFLMVTCPVFLIWKGRRWGQRRRGCSVCTSRLLTQLLGNSVRVGWPGMRAVSGRIIRLFQKHLKRRKAGGSSLLLPKCSLEDRVLGPNKFPSKATARQSSYQINFVKMGNIGH